MSDLAERRALETEIYRPAEDSHLLARAAAGRVTETDLVLDVGTGSGYVGEHLADEVGATVVASDVNPHACRAARRRSLPTVRGDLVGPFRDRTFDVVVFNPPYLPTDPKTERSDWMERALSGGPSGRAIIDPFLAEVGRVLVPGGRVVMLVSTLTGVDAIVETAGEYGFSAQVLAEESFPFETLVAIECFQ